MTSTLVDLTAPGRAKGSSSAPSGRAARSARGTAVRGGVRPRRPVVPRPAPPRGAAIATTAMFVVAGLCGWALLQVLVLGALGESRAQNVLYSQLREELAAQKAPTGGAIAPGRPVAVLTIPTLGLRQVVVEGTASGDLLSGPGHRRDTVLPGQAGPSIIYGRATTYGGPFRSLTTLQVGDGIQVTTGQGEFVYRVDGVRRAGDLGPRSLTAGEGRLTLVTAEGTGLLAALTPSQAVYVDATLQGTGVNGPAGRPAGVPGSEKALGRDTSVLPYLGLVLQGLLAAVVGVMLIRRRLPGRVTWIVAVPVLVALAWLATDAAAELLPNLI
jgi:sortase A